MPATIITIKPAPGLRVLDPATMQPLPPEGAQVAKSTHWIRRINAGDVVVIPTAKTAAKSAAKPAENAAKE